MTTTPSAKLETINIPEPRRAMTSLSASLSMFVLVSLAFTGCADGDINRNGVSDVLMGARFYDNGPTDELGVVSFFGGATCGNGTLETGEGCDDGNLNNGDGCNSDCLIELGQPCAGVDAACASGACNPVGSVCCAPMPEICDGLDNDCDGVVDNGNPGGGALCQPVYDPQIYPGPRDKGACAPGILMCNGMGELVCVGGHGPQPEVCDGIDDDCDGMIDETGPAPDGIDGSANPFPPPTASIGDPCGIAAGACEPGTFICLNGLFACLGGTLPGPEICDGLDNDCDGTIDEQCIEPCGNGKIDVGEACDDGNTFDGDGCNAACRIELGRPCNLGPAACASGFCVDGVCCEAPSCPGGDQCYANVCQPGSGQCGPMNGPDGSSCDDKNACTKSDICQSGVCQGTNPVTCSALDECHVAGTCNPTSGVCDDPAKPEGTLCSMGTCQVGICGASCASNADCAAGYECFDEECVRVIDDSLQPTLGCACTAVGENGAFSQTWRMALAALGALLVRRRPGRKPAP